jgi:hypothetical protein
MYAEVRGKLTFSPIGRPLLEPGQRIDSLRVYPGFDLGQVGEGLFELGPHFLCRGRLRLDELRERRTRQPAASRCGRSSENVHCVKWVHRSMQGSLD